MSTMQPASPYPAYPMGNSAGSGRFTPLDPIRILKQYKWLLILTAIIGVILGVVLYYVLLEIAPKYTATSIVMVTEPTDPNQPGGITYITENALERFKMTQAFYLGSDKVLRKVLMQKEVRSLDWFKQFNKQVEPALKELKDDLLSIIPVRDTSYIQINVEMTSPDEARVICFMIVKQYKDLIDRSYSEQSSTTNQMITSDRAGLNLEIQALKRKAAELMSPGESTSIVLGLQDLQAEKIKLLTEQTEMIVALHMSRSGLEQMLQDMQSSDFDYSASDEQMVEQDSNIMVLDRQILQLNEELRVTLDRFGLKHRLVKDINNRIKAAEVERHKKIGELLRKYQEVKKDSLDSQVSMIESRLTDIGVRLQEIKQIQSDYEDNIRKYDQAQRELETKIATMDEYDKRIKDIRFAERDPRSVRVQIVQQAERPKIPSSPKKLQTFAGVPMALLALVTGLIFLRELLDQRIKGPSCTKLLPKTDLLGVIPASEEDPSGNLSLDMVVAKHPNSLLAETFRQLRTEIRSKLKRSGHKTLMLVSSQAGGGVSSIASNLAVSAATNGKKIMLLDANFRRPNQHRIFGVSIEPGLGEYLANGTAINEIIQKTEIENLDVITIGAAEGMVLERLESSRFTDLIKELEKTYDAILIDAPPLSVVSDSKLLANRVGAVVIIVRAMNEKRGLVSRMIRNLEDANAELLGLILNGVRSSAGGYFRRNYKAYYDYQKVGSGRKSKT